jgi:DMSO reductase family type II enzyme heme b subunit
MIVLIALLVFLFLIPFIGNTQEAEEAGEEEEGEEEEGEDEDEEEEEEEVNVLGKELYDGFCARCHGFEGDGQGEASNYTYPKPRDFTSGIYKFRTTPSGEPPTDDDIRRIILRGNPGTSMPPWEGKFNDEELQAIVEYLKAFSEETFEFPGEPFEIGEPPPVTDELLKKGEEIYDKSKCWECHGKFGRGDGEKGWQDGFRDDWGDRIYPTNLAHSWEIRHGASVKDLYRTVTAGFDGTPMASFQDAYDDKERWALSYFLLSLQVKRKFNIILKMKNVLSIPTSTEDTLWDKVDHIDIKMEGDKVFGLPFIPMITNIRIRGLFTFSEVAIMLEWADRKPNKGDDDFPPDAVRLQFPAARNLFNIWYWSAMDNRVVEFNATSPQTTAMTRQKKTDVAVISHYKDGLYRVIFTRTITRLEENDVHFAIGKRVPFSIVAYDGQHREKDERGSRSSVRYILLERQTSL